MKVEQFSTLGQFAQNNSKAGSKKPEDYLNDLHQIAQANNGKLLSTQWLGNHHRYCFEFGPGKIFHMSARNIKKDGWPKRPELLGRTGEDFIKQMQEIALANNGKLLTTEWQGAKHKYTFCFEDGREFKRTQAQLKDRGWPSDPDLYFIFSNAMLNKETKPYDLPIDTDKISEKDNQATKIQPTKKEEAKIRKLSVFAQQNNAKLLSAKWKGEDYNYGFLLSNGKKVKISARHLKEGGWPTDIDSYIEAKEPGKNFLEKMSQIALERKGQLLSSHWKGRTHQYDFIDEYGVEFKASYRGLVQGQWSPDRGLVSEPLCAQALKHMFGVEFIKTRKVLSAERINRKSSLELDGYNEELKIAFEYQGHPSHWKKSHPGYKETYKRDILKKHHCKELGILLIEIPKFEETSKKWESQTVFNHVLQAVIQAYSTQGKKLPKLNLQGFQANLADIYHAKQMLEQLDKIAQENGGKLLSTQWLGKSWKYLFETADGQTFEKSSSEMKRTGWPSAIHRVRLSEEQYLQELKDIATENNATLLSTQWLGCKHKYSFQRECGTIFTITQSQLKDRGWPPLRDTNASQVYLNELMEIATNNKGKLLSQEWKNNKTQYLFQTHDGIIFAIRATDMKQRGWPSEERINKCKVLAM